jgi:hypothetical protein
VRLFSTILRREPDGRYVLVTPVEKVGIKVEDAPFVAVRVDAEGVGQELRLRFLTNVGDDVVAGAEHPLRIAYRGDEPRPYVHIRGGLEARVSRAVFYELVAMAEEREASGGRELGVCSDGAWFSLGSPDA